jgi:hypothetical protein
VETRIIHCVSQACARPFQLNEFQFSAEASLPWKRGEVICPHCGATTAGNAGSVFLTHALSSAQEAQFNGQPGNAAVTQAQTANNSKDQRPNTDR